MEFFTQSFQWEGLVRLLIQVAAVLLCLTVHETCHGLAALALGDPTAKRQHRLSLNPLRHLDPLGTLMMLVAGFGWAKPVMIDPRYFKNPKAGMAVTALAGPVSNFLLALAALLVRGVVLAAYVLSEGSGLLGGVISFLETVAVLSVGLGLFNLIPFPPLDGSKVAEAFLPDRIYFQILRYERWGMVVLVLVLWTGLLDVPLAAAQQWVLQWLVQVGNLPYFALMGLLG
ncbi:site-2 protease family protein [Pseudoflavonifractor phocaeensis]|uniref:site-2 protease family protein n=1 Tax=Pseudoflavonifractor phocaeensis TaxID=1870988 RepID=UPI0019565FB9|nr:site-2 protease family protein [Pseudoflavonifractor phocaeensis]MBM6869600.1 site-2 protease family protein [Pseudoflavonifractor phocaeensis]MBM6938506.1 site-2 protease family protein [Pseudoflavonifractor phocaeensis]